jgi:hypothetical protein
MTEAEWLTFATQECGFIWEADCLIPLINERKCRLFAVACCRRIWMYIPHEAAKRLIEAFERAADALVSTDEWRDACEDYELPKGESMAEKYALSAVVTCRFDKETRLTNTVASYCLATLAPDALLGEKSESRDVEERAQCDLIREIFGNPFRPVAFDPAWLTSDVRLLATGIYDEKAFDRLPILADALQDAGCDSDDILNHLRDATATHVRGCWALDLVLGKT